MKRTKCLTFGWLGLAAALGLFAPAAWAGGADEFTLTRAIPTDVFMVAHARSHEGQAFLKAQQARVWDALVNSGIDKEVKKLIASIAQEEGGEAQVKQTEEAWTKVSELLAGVDWATLGERESAFAMRFGNLPFPEFVFLFMPPASKVDANFTGLAAMLDELVKLAPEELALASDDAGDTQMRTLSPKNAPFPINLTLARHKDVLVISFGGSLGEQVVAMLKEPGGETLAKSERFIAAFKELPAPVDSLSFVDFTRLLTQLRGAIDNVMQMTPTPAPDDPNYATHQSLMKLPGKIIDAFDMFEYAADVSATRDKRTTTDSITILKADAKSKPLYAVFFGNGPMQSPLKYIPENAGGFSVSSGIDLLALYKEVVRFIGAEVPNGAELIAQWNEQQTQAGFNVETELLSWIQGSMTSFDVPGASAYATGDFVFMIGVRDEAKAGEMIGKLVALVEPMLTQQNGAIEDAEIAGATGFKSFAHPMLGMMQLTRPTIGVHAGSLIIGSSPKVIEASLAVAAGSAPNFGTNKRFLAEGISPAANVSSLSFTDTSTMGRDLAQLLRMVPMFGAMAGPEVGKNPVLAALLRCCSKLAPVVEKLDYFQSDCSMTTVDGLTIRSQTINNYRDPAATPEGERPGGESQNSSNGR